MTPDEPKLNLIEKVEVVIHRSNSSAVTLHINSIFSALSLTSFDCEAENKKRIGWLNHDWLGYLGLDSQRLHKICIIMMFIVLLFGDAA